MSADHPASDCSASPPLLRILCLHGFRQTTANFYGRTSAFRKTLRKVARLEYLEAPFLLEEDPRKLGDEYASRNRSSNLDLHESLSLSVSCIHQSPVMTRVLSLPGGRKSMGAAGEEVRKMAWPNALSGGGVVGGERRAASPTCRPGACFGQFAVRCPVLTSRFVVPASTWW